MAHDVFISYASEDKAVAYAVCEGLEKQGIRCWIAPRNILPAEQYDDAIIRAITAARVMVVIFSSNVFKSQYVKSEVERGFSKDLIIVPFRIEAIEPKEGFELYLGRRQWLDAMAPPLEAHIYRLSSTIRTLLQPAPPQPEARPSAARGILDTLFPRRPAQQAVFQLPAKRGMSRPLVLIGGIILGVSLCVVGVIFLSGILNHPATPTPNPGPTSIPPQTVQKEPDLSVISPSQIDQSLPQVPEIPADVRQLLVDTIVEADKAEIAALYYRDTSYLTSYYDGDALRLLQNHINDLINQKMIVLSYIDLNQSYYTNVRMVGSTIIAVDACEYWKSLYYDDTTYALVTETPWTLNPQTINYELIGNEIKITSISFYQNNAFCTR